MAVVDSIVRLLPGVLGGEIVPKSNLLVSATTGNSPNTLAPKILEALWFQRCYLAAITPKSPNGASKHQTIILKRYSNK